MTQKGICAQSVLSLRTEPNNRQELCTQALFGELYEIKAYSPDEKWAFIKLLADGYEGWVDAFQLHPITESFYELAATQPYGLSADSVAKVQIPHQAPHQLSLGSTLPLFKVPTQELMVDENTTLKYEGKVVLSDTSAPPAQMLEYALQFLNVPYLWGGKTLFGIDCSGFVQQVFRLSGYSLWRDAYQQAQQGNTIRQIQEAQTGDLAFFERQGRTVHVGIVVEQRHAKDFFPSIVLREEERFIIHALEKVRIDLLDGQGILNLQHQIYTHTLAQIRRMD